MRSKMENLMKFLFSSSPPPGDSHRPLLGFPTVPKGKERLRAIVTAGHTIKDLEFAIKKFIKVGKKLNIV